MLLWLSTGGFLFGTSKKIILTFFDLVITASKRKKRVRGDDVTLMSASERKKHLAALRVQKLRANKKRYIFYCSTLCSGDVRNCSSHSYLLFLMAEIIRCLIQ